MSEKNKVKTTTIQVYGNTWFLLNSLRKCGESFDMVILRLIDEHFNVDGEKNDMPVLKR